MAFALGKKLTGLVAATFTPFTPEGEINLAVIEPYIDYLVNKQHVNNIFVNGTTGESVSLTVGERKALVEEWCKKARGKIGNVIVHVGCMSLKDSQELARHAAEAGADGIAVISPSFFKPCSIDALRRFLQEVALVAPAMPFYYYHLPDVTGVNLPVRDLLKDIETLIPSFMGVKFSGSDLVDFGQCVHSQPNLSLLYGVDEQILAGLVFGANGAVGSTYNYLGAHVNVLISAFEAGDMSEAREIQFKVQDLICFACKMGFDVGVNKQLMSDLSGLCLGPPRLPVLSCPTLKAVDIAEKYRSLFPAI